MIRKKWVYVEPQLFWTDKYSQILVIISPKEKPSAKSFSGQLSSSEKAPC